MLDGPFWVAGKMGSVELAVLESHAECIGVHLFDASFDELLVEGVGLSSLEAMDDHQVATPEIMLAGLGDMEMHSGGVGVKGKESEGLPER